MAGAATRFFGVFLVVFLCPVKRAGHSYFGDYGGFGFWLQLGNHFFCHFFLFVRYIEDGAAVLVADVWSLAVQLGRVVHAKKLL